MQKCYCHLNSDLHSFIFFLDPAQVQSIRKGRFSVVTHKPDNDKGDENKIDDYTTTTGVAAVNMMVTI